MKDLTIYGAGGFGREVEFLIEQINHDKKQWNFIGFFDDGDFSHNPFGLNILGGMRELNLYQKKVNVVIAVANPQYRHAIVSQIENPHISFPVIRHPNANIGSDKNKMGRGTIITDGCRMTVGVEISDFVIINLNATLGHDVRIGAYTSIMPGVHISGNVNVGSQVLIGTGAVILQNLTIANYVRVGAGAVVTKSIHQPQTWVGVPARRKS